VYEGIYRGISLGVTGLVWGGGQAHVCPLRKTNRQGKDRHGKITREISKQGIIPTVASS